MTETRSFTPLVASSPLRIATVFLFYFCQGVPLGLFYFATPAYMAASGARTGEIATVLGLATLPWTLKLVNGFIMDRYTFLPMGRRRIWIVGAQSVMVLGLLAGALLAPAGRDVLLLATLGFAINMATTFQDVAIDGLVVDIMSEDEQAKAGGVMFGAQILGISASTAMNGRLIDAFGVSAGYLASAAILSVVLVYGLLIREREGERRLPWSVGQAHPRNIDLQIDAWLPLLRSSFKAITAGVSLLFLPFLLIRAIPSGATEVFHPVLGSQYAGWDGTRYTDTASAAQLGAAVLGLAVGGFLASRLGPQRTLAGVFAIYVAVFVFTALAPAYWSNSGFVTLLIWLMEILGILAAISMIPLAMQLCSPAVAATQFTLYMATANFGRPIGAWLGGALTGGDHPERLYWTLAAIFAIAAATVTFIRLPGRKPAVELKLAHGAGAAPAEN